ncbi:hypothetical protein [Alkalihalobacillus pseudalcaliphilus]|uniref:hypothetical protein n=1 Tax=Alkalihalobacillus pseudalcaliphilus TaxID=79884 RepID=UPI00064E060B|nr:hypothetical protein [Alkalihalobacillus pseudalcaliphilus]KMK74778.1 hypothetical protein AB990_20050 [Alkalihalobacillus pseudalcaliphilus]
MSRKSNDPVQRDIFTDLMFGRPPEPQPKKSSFTDSIEQCIHLIDKISPAIEKLAPLLIIAQALISDKGTDDSNKKKEIESKKDM